MRSKIKQEVKQSRLEKSVWEWTSWWVQAHRNNWNGINPMPILFLKKLYRHRSRGPKNLLTIQGWKQSLLPLPLPCPSRNWVLKVINLLRRAYQPIPILGVATKDKRNTRHFQKVEKKATEKVIRGVCSKHGDSGHGQGLLHPLMKGTLSEERPT